MSNYALRGQGFRIRFWIALILPVFLSLPVSSQSNQIEGMRQGQRHLDSAAVKLKHGLAHQSLLYLESAQMSFQAVDSDSGKLAVAIQRIESLNRLGRVLEGDTLFQKVRNQVLLKSRPRLHALLLLAYGRNLVFQGSIACAWEVLEEAKAISKSINDSQVAGWVAFLEGMLYQQALNPKVARTHFQEALNHSHQSGDLDFRGYCWYYLAETLVGTSSFGLATNFQDSLRCLADEHQMPQHHLHEHLLDLREYLRLGSSVKSQVAMKYAQELVNQLDNDWMRSDLQLLSFVYKQQLPFNLAGNDQLIAEADTCAAKGYVGMQIRLYQYLVTAYNQAGDSVKLMKYVHASLDHANSTGNLLEEGAGLAQWGHIEAHRGNRKKALVLMKRAFELLGSQVGPGVRYTLQSNVAVHHYFNREYSEAKLLLEQAFEHIDAVELVRYKTAMHRKAGQIYRTVEPNLAIFHLEQALELVQDIPGIEEERICRYFLKEIYRRQGNYRKASDIQEQLYRLIIKVFEKERASSARSLEIVYEDEKKRHLLLQAEQEKELQQLKLDQQENELVRNRQYLLLVVLGSLLAFASGLFLFYRYRTSRENERLQLRAQQLELEREREQANQQLQMAEWRTNIFTNVAHELRTPLTLILGPLRQGSEEPEGVKQDEVKRMRHQAENLLELLNETLDMARSGEASERFRLERFEVSPFVSEVVQSFDPLAIANHIRIQLEDHAAGIYLYFDRLALRKILVNLLGNAFKYGKPDGCIRVGLEETAAGQLQLRVQDQGGGISPDQLPQIFDRFYQVDEEATGSGLGLALVRELVERDGGEISVSSEVGTGTTFTVLLPIERPKQVQENLTVSEQANTSVEVTRKTILVVEDHSEMRDYVSRLLQPMYRVITAADGEQGIALAESQQPDLIVSDIMMPVKDGLALTSYLKTQLETSHIPIVMLTARAALDQKLEGLETGADDYLSKPFHPDELKQRIKNLLQQREQLRAVYARDHQLEVRALATNKRDQDFLEKAHTIIEKQLDNPEFSVDDFCRELALNRTSVHHKFKALTGGSTGQFIRGFRVRKAAALLLETDLPVGDVSTMVGFNSRQAFYNAFREVFEATPSEYRKEPVSPKEPVSVSRKS